VFGFAVAINDFIEAAAAEAAVAAAAADDDVNLSY